MIEIKIDNAHSQIITEDFTLKEQCSKVLSYEVAGSTFARLNNPFWDGRIKLMKKNGTFPTGLLVILVGYLKRQGIKYVFTDVRSRPSGKCAYKLNLPFTARDYQLAAAATERTRGVIVMGTGGGKSPTSALFVDKQKVQTLIVTPDTGLREQLSESYREWFGAKNIGNKITGKEPIIIANIQSLAKKDLGLFLRFQMLIIDEFHHAAAKTYQTVNAYCRNAYYRYGFTGTFMRSDGADMEMYGVLSQVIYRKTTSELIEDGYLVRPYITIVKHQVPKLRCDYQRAYNFIVTDKSFNDLVARIARKKAFDENKQTIILVRRKEHGRELADRLDGAVYLNGDDDLDHREREKRRFITKKTRLLIATSIFGEGTDIPSIDVLINARCQKTEIQTAQGIGRTLRLCPGKDKAEVFDFMIDGQKHLNAHSIERLSSYKKESAFKIRMLTNAQLFAE